MFCGVLLVAVGVGCGEGGGDPSPEVGQELQRRVVEIRSLATALEPGAAAAKLTELQAAVATYEHRGELDADAAREIVDAAGGVQAQLALIAPTTTTTTSVVTPAPSPPTTRQGKGGKRPGGDDERDDD